MSKEAITIHIDKRLLADSTHHIPLDKLIVAQIEAALRQVRP